MTPLPDDYFQFENLTTTFSMSSITKYEKKIKKIVFKLPVKTLREFVAIGTSWIYKNYVDNRPLDFQI